MRGIVERIGTVAAAIVLVSGAVCAPSPSIAAPAGAAVQKAAAQSDSSLRRSVRFWLQKMKKRVTRAQARHNQVVAVAAVRGSEAPDSPPLYWKGKKAKGPVSPMELEAFDGAVESALSGSRADAIGRLENFLKSYPQSSLADDANATLSLLRDE